MLGKFKVNLRQRFISLMKNSVFGKTQENLRNSINVEVIINQDVALKRVCKPSFKRLQTILEELIIMNTEIANLKICKPVYSPHGISYEEMDMRR